MGAEEYRHLVLGYIFLKYVSEKFIEVYTMLETQKEDLTDPEDCDEYISRNLFLVPPDARYEYRLNNATNFQIIFLTQNKS